MKTRMLVSVGALGIALLMAAPASAKTIVMPGLSRVAVDQACSRAGGQAYGIHDTSSVYGCATRRGSVECTPDGQCAGFVSDLFPIAANSLDAVLGGGVHAGPVKLGPTERRITPVVQKP